MREIRVGGIVSGSVSITNARKKNEECWSVWVMAVSGVLPWAVTTIVTSDTSEKARIRSKRRILRTMSNPPISTNGRSDIFPPTHQVADWSTTSAASATPNAAGLKICFLPMASTYFDAIAHTEARMRNQTPVISVGETGAIMIARISAVMYTDSTLVCAA